MKLPSCVYDVHRFVVIDMSVDGSGEWTKWGNASFFGAPFIWTTLHDFGGTDGMKGISLRSAACRMRACAQPSANELAYLHVCVCWCRCLCPGDLARINEIPFRGLTSANQSTVFGTGYTPEGIDQNPVYYEFMAQANFRSALIGDIASWAVDRAHRRYGLSTHNTDVRMCCCLCISPS